MLELDITSEQLERALEKDLALLQDTTPLMAGIVTELLSETERNFELEGRPRWQGLKVPRPGGKILQKSGQLAASITPWHDREEAGIGSNKPYAAIHQLGGQTRPHVIKPRNKKALAFGGRVVAKVNHPGSRIPARPYLPILPDGNLQPEAEEAVMDVVQIYFRQIGG